MNHLQTYAETENINPFNWNKFLSKKSYTKKNLTDANYLSEKWVSCAVGTQCAIIPRHAYKETYGLDIKMQHEPIDSILSKLGYKFNLHIEKMVEDYDDFRFLSHRARAIKTLKAIEKRSSILIKEILKNSK